MQDIIYFGNDWFAENKTSSHHIAERLARNNRVLYVECPGLRAPKGSGRDLKKIFSKVAKCLRGPQKIHDQLHVYTLFQLPFHRYGFVRAINRWLVSFSIKLQQRILKIKNPVLWFVVPHLYMVPDRVKHRACVYYCIDDYSAIPDVDVDAVQKMDDEMSRQADILFLASETLLDKKRELNKHVNLSPHGVDFDHFNQAMNKQATSEFPLQNISGPIIGCFGLIDERIDLALIAEMAIAKPEWQFIFIGRLDVDSNPCEQLANVHFLGRKPYAELPHYAMSFNVTLMPYKPKHRMNINCNPLKLREYLSTGLPVVSARIPQAEQYADVIGIADTPHQFIEAIDAALQDNSDNKKHARLERVRTFTWDARVDTVINSVNQRLLELHPNDNFLLEKV